MKLDLIILGLLSLAISGCAHSAMRGSVAMKTSDTEVHVCMDKNEAKVGDRVRLFRNKCRTKGSSRAGVGTDREAICVKELLGTGMVTQNLNDHYSVVKFEDGIQFEEGAFVEKY